MKRSIPSFLCLVLLGACASEPRSSVATDLEQGNDQPAALLETAGGCACPTSGLASLTLDCFCAEFPGACPSYDEVKQWARPGVEHWGGCFDDSAWFVTEQTGCGKLVVAMLPGLGGWSYTYSEATHELIGAQVSSDVSFGSCEAASYVAGESSRCDAGTVCSLCDDSGTSCAAACSIEWRRQTWGTPRYEDEAFSHDCGVPKPGRILPELRTGCGRIQVVTELGTNTYSANTHELLSMENASDGCGGRWGDPGPPCADETSCSLCDDSPNRCAP